MTIFEYAEKTDILKYLTNDMIAFLEEWQKFYDVGRDLQTTYYFRAGKALLSTLIQKYTSYMEGCKDGRAEAIDEFNALLKEHPMTSNFDWDYYDEIAEQMKEKEND